MLIQIRLGAVALAFSVVLTLGGTAPAFAGPFPTEPLLATADEVQESATVPQADAGEQASLQPGEDAAGESTVEPAGHEALPEAAEPAAVLEVLATRTTK